MFVSGNNSWWAGECHAHDCNSLQTLLQLDSRIQWLGVSLLLPVWARILSPDLSWSLTHSTGTFRVFVIFVFCVLFSLLLRLRISWAGVCMLVCTCACLTFAHYNKREIFYYTFAMHKNFGISVPSKNKTLTWLLIKFEWVRLIHTAFKPSVELLWTKNRPHASLTGCLLLSWAIFPGSMSCIHHYVTYSQAALPPVWALLTMTPISAETKSQLFLSLTTHSSTNLSSLCHYSEASQHPSHQQPKRDRLKGIIYDISERRKELKMFLLSFSCPSREDIGGTLKQ